eukprot:Opistho-1_new@65807
MSAMILAMERRCSPDNRAATPPATALWLRRTTTMSRAYRSTSVLTCTWRHASRAHAITCTGRTGSGWAIKGGRAIDALARTLATTRSNSTCGRLLWSSATMRTMAKLRGRGHMPPSNGSSSRTIDSASSSATFESAFERRLITHTSATEKRSSTRPCRASERRCCESPCAKLPSECARRRVTWGITTISNDVALLIECRRKVSGGSSSVFSLRYLKWTESSRFARRVWLGACSPKGSDTRNTALARDARIFVDRTTIDAKRSGAVVSAEHVISAYERPMMAVVAVSTTFATSRPKRIELTSMIATPASLRSACTTARNT